jgi:hypothetical protein
MNKKINYSNLFFNIQREREEVATKNFNQVDEILAERYKIKRPPYIREGISTTREEIDLAKEMVGRLAQLNPLDIPPKSKIYRAGLQVLKDLPTEEIAAIIKSLK